MLNTTAKSHKSRKTVGEPGEPRQRTVNPLMDTVTLSSPLVISPSSDVPVATASGPSDTPQATPVEGANSLPPIVPLELPREQQLWYRPYDSKMRPKAEKIAVMRAAGHSVTAIAKRLNTTEGTVRTIEYHARKNGWYDEDGDPVDIEAELANNIDRKVVRNISASLDGVMTNWQTHETTLAAAKGRGMFKNHDKVEGSMTQLPIVAIQVVMPAIGAGDQLVLDEKNIGGVPAYIEGEVTDGLFQSNIQTGERNTESTVDTHS